jgi:hypothetical protein
LVVKLVFIADLHGGQVEDAYTFQLGQRSTSSQVQGGLAVVMILV